MTMWGEHEQVTFQHAYLDIFSLMMS